MDRPEVVDTALRSLLEFAGVPYADAMRVELTADPSAPTGVLLVVEHIDRNTPCVPGSTVRKTIETRLAV